jgi:hypothetical protein
MTTIATPIRVAPAYEDRDAVFDAVARHAPYPLMSAGAGYGELIQDTVRPWFRSHWALDGKTVDDEAERLLYHEPFIEASRELYDATVVRPINLIVNLMGPMAGGGVHVDTPSFRGLMRSEMPVWLLYVMGASGLFERWMMHVAGALTWFYDGHDGQYEFWSRGVGHEPEVVAAPFGNEAVVADNDRMPHRVGPIGDPEDFASRVRMAPEAVLEWRDIGWSIASAGGRPAHLSHRDIRVSIIWKALTFADDRDARRHDAHEDDLDLSTIVETFCADLGQRGIAVDRPADPLTDQPWITALTSTYMPRRQPDDKEEVSRR